MHWGVFAKRGFSEQHVIPLDDLRPHDVDGACWCKPVEDDDEPLVLMHNSLDGREAFERGERAPS